MTTNKSINLDATIYAADSKKAGAITLPEAVFGLSWNSDLVHQVVMAMKANARQSSAHTKDRSEVSGSNKKPWAQKGTGRARHGSTRSPIWRTGGVTFGPRNEKDYSQKINRKMKVKALYTVLSRKFKDGEVLLISDFALSAPKTKDARATLTKLGSISGYEAVGICRNNAAYIILSKADANVKRVSKHGNVGVQ